MPAMSPEERKLREQLKPRSAPPEMRTRGRQVGMTAADHEAFTRVLLERFPKTVLSYREKIDENSYQPVRIDSFADIECGFVYAFCSDDWDPTEYFGEPKSSKSRTPSSRSFFFYVCNRVYNREFPDGKMYDFIGDSCLHCNYYNSDRDQKNFVARVVRCLNKVTTNSLEGINILTGETEKMNPYEWEGYDALRWAQGAPDRMLPSHIRPADDWVMPDSPYYD